MQTYNVEPHTQSFRSSPTSNRFAATKHHFYYEDAVKWCDGAIEQCQQRRNTRSSRKWGEALLEKSIKRKCGVHGARVVWVGSERCMFRMIGSWVTWQTVPLNNLQPTLPVGCTRAEGKSLHTGFSGRTKGNEPRLGQHTCHPQSLSNLWTVTH